ncbi:MAG TPA: hypothetical protein VGN17_07480 [Bryobacteraceae bacterium]|jgi:predicted nucleic acid-binding protein
MIVVADTTPLRYLIAIDRDQLLPALYGRVLIPPAVGLELSHESTPAAVRTWMASQPSWLDVRQPNQIPRLGIELGKGEEEAIALAEEVAADLLLIDEWDARREAARRSLRVVGTLRVLADGAARGLADLEESFRRLRQTNFRVHPELLEALLKEQQSGKPK